MDVKYIEIKDETGRLDKILTKKLPLSRSQIKNLIDSGNITLNHLVTKANVQPKKGDLIEIKSVDRKPLTAEPEAISLNIIYEDDDLLVVNKPAGMVVHPANGHYHGTLVNGLVYHTQLALNGYKYRPGIVHRIDKDTSGLLMVAKSELALHSLSNQLKEKKTVREYLALVHGQIKEDEGTISAPLGRDPRNRFKRAVVLNGKKAITHFFVKKRFNSYTLISCKLETGRTHQIRVHMKYIGHPLVGDPLYGPRNTTEIHQGQLLHAKKLGFFHPRSHQFMEFETQLPLYFSKILNDLEK